MAYARLKDVATLYILMVCTGKPTANLKHEVCEAPFGRAASLSRQDCVEHSWLIRAGNHSKRVLCIAPDHIGGSYRPDDVIDSAGILRPEYPMAPSGK